MKSSDLQGIRQIQYGIQAAMNFEVFFVGLAVGYFSGLFGKGGSAIATPLLQLVGVPPFFAVASPLPATIPGTIVGAFAYSREGLIDKKIVLWGIVAGVPATILGSFMSQYVGGRNLLLASDIVLALIGISFLIPGKIFRSAPTATIKGHLHENLPLNICIALIVGFVSGILANAGGFLLAPLYRKVLKLPLKTAFACSLMVSAVLAVPGTLTHLMLGHIDWKVVAVFGLGSIPLSYLGARTAIRMPVSKLEPLFGVVLTLIGVWGTVHVF